MLHNIHFGGLKMNQKTHSSFILNEEDKAEEPKKPKKLTRWKIFFLISLSAVITIIYVDNVLHVNYLLKDNQNLKKSYKILKNNNDILRTRLNSLQSPERIIPIAEKELGLVKSQKAPDFLKTN